MTSYPRRSSPIIKQDIAYTIDLLAEQAGSVDLKVRVLGNGRVERTGCLPRRGTWLERACTADAHAGHGPSSKPAGWPVLQVDTDGDGTFEGTIRRLLCSTRFTARTVARPTLRSTRRRRCGRAAVR